MGPTSKIYALHVMRILDSQFACAMCAGEYSPPKGITLGSDPKPTPSRKQTQLAYPPLLKLGLTTLTVELGNFTWNPPSQKYLILASNNLYPQAFLLHPVSTTIYSIGPNSSVPVLFCALPHYSIHQVNLLKH